MLEAYGKYLKNVPLRSTDRNQSAVLNYTKLRILLIGCGRK
ncbi:MAG: hypothetical protein OFPII_38500 [Osedax symbiont Rs1]|nr:MAG: hypothetical protein OFPII_38500 [Osedax symbiont Rs1]